MSDIDFIELDSIKPIHKMKQQGHFCHGLTKYWFTHLSDQENLFENLDMSIIKKYQNDNIFYVLKLYRCLLFTKHFKETSELIKYIVVKFNKKRSKKLTVILISQFSYNLSKWHEIGLYKNQFFDANIGWFEFEDLYTCLAWFFISRNLKYRNLIIL